MADTTRADSPARPQSAGGGAKGKQFLGQPTWLWIAGAGVGVLGYLHLKSHQTQQKGQGQGQHGGSGGGGGGGGYGGGPTGWTSESFQRWTRQHHNHPIKRRGA